MNSEWKWVRCDEFIDFNPKETLKKRYYFKKSSDGKCPTSSKIC